MYYIYFAFLLTLIMSPLSYTMDPGDNTLAVGTQILPKHTCGICGNVLQQYQSRVSCINDHLIHKSCAINNLAQNFTGQITAQCPQCKEDCEDLWMASFDKVEFRKMLNKIKQQTKNSTIELLARSKENGLLSRQRDHLQKEFQTAKQKLESIDPQLLKDSGTLKNERIEHAIDNRFNQMVQEKTVKRFELSRWQQAEQSKLNSYSKSLLGLSILACCTNYVSPLWTHYLITGDTRHDWKNLSFWATQRAFLTQYPIYIALKAILDFKQYKLNMEELDLRINYSKECKFNSKIEELESFKRRYKELVFSSQILVSALLLGAGLAIPFLNTEKELSVPSKIADGIIIGLYAGGISEQITTVSNQKWFDNNKPLFDNKLQIDFIDHQRITRSREHIFSANIPR